MTRNVHRIHRSLDNRLWVAHSLRSVCHLQFSRQTSQITVTENILTQHIGLRPKICDAQSRTMSITELPEPPGPGWSAFIYSKASQSPAATRLVSLGQPAPFRTSSSMFAWRVARAPRPGTLMRRMPGITAKTEERERGRNPKNQLYNIDSPVSIATILSFLCERVMGERKYM